MVGAYWKNLGGNFYNLNEKTAETTTKMVKYIIYHSKKYYANIKYAKNK